MKAYTLLMQLESEFPFERQVLHLNYNRNEPIYFYLTIQIIFPHYKAWHLFFRQESFVFIMTLYLNIYNWSARKGGGGRGWRTKDDMVYIHCLRPLLNIVRKKEESQIFTTDLFILILTTAFRLSSSEINCYKGWFFCLTLLQPVINLISSGVNWIKPLVTSFPNSNIALLASSIFS